MILRVAVLGANGFIGGRAVERFHLAELAEVRPVVRSLDGLARLARFDLDGRVADAFDQAALRTAFAGCEAVIHAVAGDRKTILGTVEPTYRAAQEAGVRRLIYLSTASVHGQAPAKGTDEDSPLRTRQPLPYNTAKVLAERKVQRLRDNGSVELVILRPGIVFGPRSYWITHFAENLLAGTAYLVNRGRGICNSIYVDNLVHALHLAMTVPEADGHAFLVGDQELVTWADLYRPIAATLGFDLAHVPDQGLPTATTTWLDRLNTIRFSDPAQAFLSFFPVKLRQAASNALLACTERPPPSPWTHPASQQPVVTPEMVLLYQCQYKLPFNKATQMLRYQPMYSFADGLERTLAWMVFAGYPVVGWPRSTGNTEPHG